MGFGKCDHSKQIKCECVCHKNQAVKHVMACCYKCDKCGFRAKVSPLTKEQVWEELHRKTN